MVHLKTLSQVKSFIKRNPDYCEDLGCGCCYNSSCTFIEKKKHKIITIECHDIAGSEQYSASVVAIINKMVELNHL